MVTSKATDQRPGSFCFGCFSAWMRTAILAPGILGTAPALGYIENGNMVHTLFLGTGLQARQRIEQKNDRRQTPRLFCLPGAALDAALRAPDAACAWQMQHLKTFGAASVQRSPPGPRTFLPSRCSTRCSGCCFFAWQVQHLEKMLLVNGRRRNRAHSRCSTRWTGFYFASAV